MPKRATTTPTSLGQEIGKKRPFDVPEVETFLNILRTGADPDKPGETLQVMPWPVYGKLTDSDIRAIYEFLRSIPHAEPGSGC